MAPRRAPSAVQTLVAAFDQLPARSRHPLFTSLARRPDVAAQMARISVAALSQSETRALWQELNAKNTRARLAQSPLGLLIRGTLLNYARLHEIANARERERLANRPGRKVTAKNRALARKAVPLLDAGKSLAEVAQLLHATDRDRLPTNYQVSRLSPPQKAALGRYLDKIVKRVKKAHSQGLLSASTH